MYHTTNRIFARCHHKEIAFETAFNPSRDDDLERRLEITIYDELGHTKKVELTRQQVETWIHMLKSMREYM